MQKIWHDWLFYLGLTLLTIAASVLVGAVVVGLSHAATWKELTPWLIGSGTACLVFTVWVVLMIVASARAEAVVPEAAANPVLDNLRELLREGRALVIEGKTARSPEGQSRYRRELEDWKNRILDQIGGSDELLDIYIRTIGTTGVATQMGRLREGGPMVVSLQSDLRPQNAVDGLQLIIEKVESRHA